MARVVRFYEHGGPEVLRIEDIDVPGPGRGEIQIHVKALGLNRAEALLRSGTYIETPALPSGLGFEAAGIVEQVGAGVVGLSPGDAVSVVPPLSQVRWPAYGELANFPAYLVVKKPPSLSWEAAAAVWMQYLTAYGALIDIAGIQRNEPVVITAASSSVGLAAIQIVNSVGAIPIAVTRTSQKARALAHVGAAHVVASAEEDLVARLNSIAGAQGLRVVFDPVGGPTLTTLMEVMSSGGIAIEYGVLGPAITPVPMATVLVKTLTLRGYLVHEITGDPVRLETAKAFILDGLTKGALEPVIAKTFAFDQIVEAHRFLESNEQFGKIVVTV